MSQTRNAERTRRAVLDAAARVMADKGAALSLHEVANIAGVSKSGLLHHFGDRDRLVVAVVADVNSQLRTAVAERLDLSENRPGKMLRAYVRTLCAEPSDGAALYFATAPTWNGLMSVPGVSVELDEDAAWWVERFAEDGLAPDVIRIVRRAAEGLAAAAWYGDESPESLAAGRDSLLRLTLEGLGH